MSPLACMQEGNPARSLYWKGASTARCTNSSQVSGTTQQWVCDGVSVFLIDTETCPSKAAKPHIRTLRGDFSSPPPFFFSVLSFPFQRQAHFSSLSRKAAAGGIITAHHITERSIMALGPKAFHACCCQYHWQAGLCRTKSWKLINSAGLTSQPFESAVSLVPIFF